MLDHYTKIAFRFLVRNKSFSAINVLGLAFGITGAMLLFLWIEREYSYDQFHTDKERVYIAWNREVSKGQINCWPTTPRILAPTLKAEYAGIEAASSYANYSDTYLFTAGDKRILVNNVFFADPDFLSMFSFPLLKGNRSSALMEPNEILLTESFAKKLFGDKEAFGEILTIGLYGETFPFTISGILKDLPPNTDFTFEYLIPWQFLESAGEKDESWGNNSVATLVKIEDGIDINSLNLKIKDIRKNHTNNTSDAEIFLYEQSRMHLYSRFENGISSGGRIDIVRMLTILGVVLIIIACINFINLSTARAQKRSKEVAVRKVTGAYRTSLVIQFLFESIMLASAAGIISLGIVYLLLPSFNTLVEQRLSLDFSNTYFWLILVGGIFAVGILAGSYPALYVSSFRPVQILKGERMISGRRNILRSLLVIFQFGFAVMMIISVIVIHKQINFVQARDNGYAKENLIYHFITGDIEKNYIAYKDEMIRSGIATSVTKTSSPITDRLSNTGGIKWRGKDPEDKTNIERFFIDEDIVGTMGISILQGRDMDLARFPSDSSAVLLNETAVALMGFKDPVGEIIHDGWDWHVIGVIKDFILTSPHQKVEPMVLQGSRGWFDVIHIRLNPARDTRQNIAGLQNIFTKYNPEYPFEYYFVDEEYKQKFVDLEKTLTITTVFSSIAIFVACLGLLGLSTYMIESRVKEIGIRKVLGGSVISITKLLSARSLRPILIAILIFSPVAWLSMNWWLQSFAYRIAMDLWIFVVGGVAILLIALITIGVQTISAANANPVSSLRKE